MKLVTGSSGFIGAHLCQRLHVKGLDRIPGPETNTVIDLADFHPAEQYNVIFHLAWDIDVSPAADVKTAKHNVAATAHALTLLKPGGLFVFVSSVAAEYPDLNVYGQTKREAEEIVQRSGLQHVIIRLANVYGPGGKGVVNQYLAGQQLIVHGAGTQVRDFIHVDDVLNWLLTVSTLPKGQVYYAGSNKFRSIISLAKLFRTMTHKKIVYNCSVDPGAELPLNTQTVLKCPDRLKEYLGQVIQKC